MSAAACLLAYAVAVAVIAPRILPRLTRSGVAPRLGVVAWLVAIASAAASSIAFVGVVAADTFAGTSVFAACEHLVRAIAGAHSIAATRFVTTAVGVAAGSALLLAAVRLTRNLAARRRVTFGHARSVLIVGRRVAGVDAVVLDAPERAAYCVAGRPDAIVVTSGALDALDHRQLDAVLAHERAHLAGRHPQLLAIVRGLADVVPRLALFTAGATDIARLLEMCADDRAMRAHTPHTLLRGLVTLAGSRPIPDGACGAGNVAVLARAGRLASPPGRGDLVRNRALLSGAIAFLGALPLGATTLAVTGRMLCLTTLL